LAKVAKIQHETAAFQALDGKIDRFFDAPGIGIFYGLLTDLTVVRQDVIDLTASSDCPECRRSFTLVQKDFQRLRTSLLELKDASDENDEKARRLLKSKIDVLLYNTSLHLSKTAQMASGEARKHEGEAKDQFQTYGFILGISTMLLVLIGIGSNYGLMRHVRGVARELSNATREFAEGNRNKRIEAALPREFAQLVEAFNSLASTIQSSEQSMTQINGLLKNKVGVQEGMLARANEQTEQKIEEIKAYIEIAEILSSSTGMDEMLDRATQTLSSACDARYVTIALIDDASLSHCWELESCDKTSCPAYKSVNLECWTLNRTHCRNSTSDSFEDKIAECIECDVFHNIKLRINATSGIDKTLISEQSVASYEPLFGKALLTLKPVIETDFNAHAELADFRAVAPDCVAHVSVPLITKNRVIGTINLGYTKNDKLNGDDIGFIERLCNQIAIGIENVLLFESTKHSAMDFSTLYRSGEALSSLLQPNKISHFALDFAMQISGANAGIVLLYNDKTHKLSVGAAENIDKDLRHCIGSSNSGIAKQIITTKEPVLFDERYKKRHFDLGPIRSGIFTPLQYNGRLFGLIGVLSLSHKNFSYNDLQLLSTISGQASTAMYNNYLFNELECLYIDTVKAFVQAIEAKDSYTRGHSENVANYATAIARKMRLSASRIKDLETAALLHDIGKIGVNEEILNKPERLTSDEYERIKQHPFIAFQILEHVPALKDIARIILHHHERYDGSGYADGLQADEIPLESRILAVADTFDAITSCRPYRRARTTLSARNELMDNAGTQFDPEVIKHFIELIDSGEIMSINEKNQLEDSEYTRAMSARKRISS
jgi:putative nucleotidyltransferase with HDIG domain